MDVPGGGEGRAWGKSLPLAVEDVEDSEAGVGVVGCVWRVLEGGLRG